jgi:hypothetical protein
VRAGRRAEKKRDPSGLFAHSSASNNQQVLDVAWHVTGAA